MCTPSLGHEPAEDMAEAASAFLSALDIDQQKSASFPFLDEERFNWDFVPKSRKGISFKEMSTGQAQQAMALLNSGLSHRGFFQAATIMSLEHVLREIEQGRGPLRDSQAYFISVFGSPGTNNTWAWRLEGHHLSLNFTIVNGTNVSATPNFFGSNPAEVKTGPRRGLRILGAEEDLGRELAKSLTAAQRKSGIVADTAYRDILVGKQRPAKRLEPTGLDHLSMTLEQQHALKTLVELYARRLRPELAEQDMKRIADASWDKVCFAWAGPLEAGKGHYYRVQGPTFVLEYDNTQNQANHIHTVWRDFANDFGDDLLKRHYELSGHHE